MAKPVSFKDVEVEPSWEIEQQIREQDLRHEAHIEMAAGLPADYLTRIVEEERTPKARRFGHGSSADGPDEVNL